MSDLNEKPCDQTVLCMHSKQATMCGHHIIIPMCVVYELEFMGLLNIKAVCTIYSNLYANYIRDIVRFKVCNNLPIVKCLGCLVKVCSFMIEKGAQLNKHLSYREGFYVAVI